MHRRSLSIAAVSAVAGLATAAALVQSAQASSPAVQHQKPTVVLVHGALADSSSWNSVTEQLQHDGYRVVAPANPLRSLSGDANYLAAYLKTISGPIVLVGHSYGGSVISEAAAGNSDVRALVYIAALAPAKGETAFQLVTKFPGTRITDDPKAPVPTALNAVPYTEGGTTQVDLYLKPDKFRDVFLSDRVSAGEAAVLAAAQRPVTAEALSEPSGTPAWQTTPSWYLVANDDHVIPSAAQRYMAARAHAHTSGVNAPHDVLLTNPNAVSKVILNAAHSVGR